MNHMSNKHKPKKRQISLTEKLNKDFSKALKKNGEKVTHVIENMILHYVESSK